MQLLTLPLLILGGVRGNFHIFPLFGMKLMWQKERLIAQQLDRGMGGRKGGQEGRESQGMEKERGGAMHGMSERAGRGRERREKEGRAEGVEGGRDREMGVHANFIILLINFSSSNPPAGTWEQIGDRDRLGKSQLILNSHPKQNSLFYSILLYCFSDSL